MSEIQLTNLKVLEYDTYWEVKGPRPTRWGFSREQIPKDRWKFNGNFNCPTFTPSINTSHTSPSTGVLHRNHFIITDGRISYCDDSTHEFRGQTLDLLFFNEAEVPLSYFDSIEPD